MARRDVPDPFEQTSNEPLHVETGTFTSTGRDHGRTGATNARAVGRISLADRWRGASQQRSVNLVAVVALVLVVAVLLPMLITLIGASRREAIAAAEAEENRVHIVVIQTEVQEAADRVQSVLGAVAISSVYVSEETGAQMRTRLDEVSTSVIDNDADHTGQLSDEALSYFTATFVPELVNRVPSFQAEWWEMNWETEGELEEALAAVQQAQQGQDVDALAGAVVELATVLGNAKDEHMRNDVTYVPLPEETTEPTQTEDSAQQSEDEGSSVGGVDEGDQGGNDEDSEDDDGGAEPEPEPEEPGLTSGPGAGG